MAVPLLIAGGVFVVGGVVLAGLLAAAVLLWQDGRTAAPAAETIEPPPAPTSPSPPPPPPPDPRITTVQPAIDKGVAFLRATLQKKERWDIGAHPLAAGQVRYGMDGLIGLTLLECGAAADDPYVLAVADELRKAGPTLRKTYVLSAALFFFNRWDEVRPLSEADSRLARSLGLRLCAGQIGKGIWRYDCPILTAAQESALLGKLEAGQVPPGAVGGYYSISNSQFAMLALWGARRHGLPVRATLLRAADHFHRTQFPDGHWLYDDTLNPTVLWTTATAAGLMALAMEKALLEDPEFNPHRTETKIAGKRADLDKAFAYVGRTVGRSRGEPHGAVHQYAGTIFQADAWGDLYYLWTIERLGMIYSRPVIGARDWYDWGYPILLKHQKADGSWQDRHQAQVDTCFALLFLRRANLARDLTRMIHGHFPAGAAPKQ